MTIKKDAQFAQMYGANPCSEIYLDDSTSDSLINTMADHYLEPVINRYFAGIPYKDIAKLLKKEYPEKFI